MKKLFIKIRNLLRATAGIPVSEPTMVTKEFPVAEPAMVTKEFPVAESEMSTKEFPVTEKKKKTSWTDFISSCVSSLIMSFGYVQKLMKFFGSVFM